MNTVVRPGPPFAELFTPKLVTVWREGNGAAHLRADAIAGLTVAIVALPLSTATAIAGPVTPCQVRAARAIVAHRAIWILK